MSAPAPRETVVDEDLGRRAAAPAKTLEALYTRPFQCHGSIGPSCAVAQWEGRQAHRLDAQPGRVPPARAISPRCSASSPSRSAASTPRAPAATATTAPTTWRSTRRWSRAPTGGRPVKLQWMRDDEFMWEPYGSAMVMKLSGGLDAQGNIVAWSHELWSHPHSTRPGSSAGVNLLAARHLAQPFDAGAPGRRPAAVRRRRPQRDPAVRLAQREGRQALRRRRRRCAPRRCARSARYANVFALESFVDELAAAAGVDPVEFRLRHMKDPRARAVIEAAAQRAGWQAGRQAATARAGAASRSPSTRTSPATARSWPTSRSIARPAG